jgi:hypothetical protein
MAQSNAGVSELRRRAVGQREHAIGSAVGRTAEVLASVEAGQRAAIEVVRGFVDSVDPTLSVRGEDASKRRSVIDAGVEMADRLVQAQHGFLPCLVRTAGSAVSPLGHASGEAGGD